MGSGFNIPARGSVRQSSVIFASVAHLGINPGQNPSQLEIRFSRGNPSPNGVAIKASSGVWELTFDVQASARTDAETFRRTVRYMTSGIFGGISADLIDKFGFRTNWSEVINLVIDGTPFVARAGITGRTFVHLLQEVLQEEFGPVISSFHGSLFAEDGRFTGHELTHVFRSMTRD
ncbi:hypothetical protein ACFL5U_00320 [Candidatus Margulisiibacteriota bacterium]